jgi:hypothetical protein
MTGKTEMSKVFGIGRVAHDGLVTAEGHAFTIFRVKMTSAAGKGMTGADGLDPFMAGHTVTEVFLPQVFL